MENNAKLLAVSAIVFSLVSMNSHADSEYSKVKTINGATYTFVKHISDNGDVKERIYDNKGNELSGKNLPAVQHSKVDRGLQSYLSKLKKNRRIDQEKIKVNIALYINDSVPDSTSKSGSIEVINGIEVRQTKNEKELSRSEVIDEIQDRASSAQKSREIRIKLASGKLLKWASEHGLTDQQGIHKALERGNSTVTVELSGKRLMSLINSDSKLVAGYELYQEPEDDINQAMPATSISTSAHLNASTRGNNIGVYMTESGCANESRITNYDRLSGSETNHARNVGAIIRAVAPDSFIYCRGGAVLPQLSDLDGVGGNPAIHVISRSNSSNDTTSYNTLDRDWDNYVYNNNVTIFNSGGNTGNGTGNVRSPGKGLNVITVGNYNDANNTIVSSSPFVDPQIGNEKPELSAPGANITAGGFTMTGTSQSTPHAAGFAANMLSGFPFIQFRPYLVKAHMLASATDTIGGGLEKVGLGGIDFYKGFWDANATYWTGSNSAFESFDTSSDGVDDGYITKTYYISGSWNNVRIVTAWLNRGTYTYDNRTASNPIGADLDMRVYGPSGNFIGGSYSWDNPYEVVNFDPTVSGTYTIKINRYANRDTSANLRLGLLIDKYN